MRSHPNVTAPGDALPALASAHAPGRLGHPENHATTDVLDLAGRDRPRLRDVSAGDASAPAEHSRRSLRLTASPTTASRARSFVVGTLRDWLVGADACDDAELVVSELVTNAFLHGRAPDVDVAVDDHGTHVRLTVAHREDVGSDGPLAPLTVGADDTHGRGLAIVDVLSRDWGVDVDGAERRVWAELVASRVGLLPAADHDAALQALSDDLAGLGDHTALAVAWARWARARLATSFAGIAVPDTATDGPPHLRYLSVEPLPAASAAEWVRFPVDTPAPVAAAYREGRAYFHESRSAAVAGFPGLGPALLASEQAALAHLPLVEGGRSIGTLALSWSHGRELDAGDRAWLVAVAQVVAAALTGLGTAGLGTARPDPSDRIRRTGSAGPDPFGGAER